MTKRKIILSSSIIALVCLLAFSVYKYNSAQNINQNKLINEVSNIENKSNIKENQFDLTFNIIDSETKEKIKNYLVVIPDLNNKYELTETDNIINIPQSPFSPNTGRYQKGYTFIIYSEGYLPIIENDTCIYTEGTILNAELSKSQNTNNENYIEILNPVNKKSIDDLLNYYFSESKGSNKYFITEDTLINNVVEHKNISDIKQGKWIIKVIDSDSKKEIDDSFIIITDLSEKYNVSKNGTVISLPQKPVSSDEGKYEAGYTIITGAIGYLPRIDHNILMYDNVQRNIIIELVKPNVNNAYFSEQQHKSDKNEITNLLKYYLGNSTYKVSIK
ncbi:hypothetical protein EHE19_006510 [Ruminiclostridium herbifermentans]|jgi:hypothetical protein|uniref:Uncharacterized protein n=1 Tax=Ruminiclostridium herbifermentans TaxID=2488810 RepID=A0A4U7JF45_9FIRM|nr:hypothetical protein [Ruminiclostridium herbifermentans]QNU68086.1 hypothetical protein EHE19_006510 [Ruminiclostridium herbifermentans]